MTAKTIIEFSMSMHCVHSAKTSETGTVEDWTGLTQADLDSMSEAEIHAAIDDAFNEWRLGQCDEGWCEK